MKKNELSRFTILIDSRLLEKVKSDAEKNKRSAGKQIEFILERYYLSISKE